MIYIYYLFIYIYIYIYINPTQVLQFVEWVCSDAGRAAGCPDVDPRSLHS